MKKLFAAFAYRFDAQLVPDMLQNIDFVDGFVFHDDRKNEAQWYHEGRVRNELIEKARRAGADWLLCVDPDERFEKSAGKKIRKLIERTNSDVIYGFHFRELWTPETYRCDGVWNNKTKFVLFPIKDGQQFDNLPVHSNWNPINQEYKRVLTNINLYHLKNIDPKNRSARAELYNSLDPNKEIQPIGYDYLADETGLKTKKVPASRLYTPGYTEDYHITQTG